MNRAYLLYLVALINFVHIVDSMLIMPMGDLFIEAFGLNAFEYSLLVSTYAIGAVLASIISFFIMDRHDRRSVLLFLFAGFIIGTFLCGLAQSYPLLLFLRFITGAFGGVLGALAYTLAADLYEFTKRGRAIGILMTSFSAASVLGVPFGLYLAATFSWRMPFYALGAFGFVIFLLAYFIFPSLNAHVSGQAPSLSIRGVILQLFRDSNQVNALILGVVLVLGHFIIIPFWDICLSSFA